MMTSSPVEIINPSQVSTMTSTADPGVGRMKAPPVCVDASLQAAAMSTQALQELVFRSEETPVTLAPAATAAAAAAASSDSIPVSSCSSTCTRESSGTLSDVEPWHSAASAAPPTDKVTPLKLDRIGSDRLNAKVSQRKISRQGRFTQRWVTAVASEGGNYEQTAIRLSTGCVPILKGGKILFVSASRKSEWILPKGGWETDESMQESAVRESFEEAGVLGVLGPKLSEVQYETRKAKKRRLELEETERQKKLKATSCEEASACGDSTVNTKDDNVERKGSMAERRFSLESNNGESSNHNTVLPVPVMDFSEEVMSRIRNHNGPTGNKASDETASLASIRSEKGYSYVRMTLFCLYVTKVCDAWPESGRFRKAVDIDEAIAMLDSRPEQQAVLREVKERGLHLVSEPLSQEGKATAR